MPVIRWLRVALPAALLLLASTALAVAQTTVTERVTDLAGVLDDGQRSVAEDAIARLDDEGNVQLWALYVDSTGGMGAPEYAEASAADSGLGANNALLVVALEDRRFGLWVGPALDEVTDDEIDEILANDLTPQLRSEAYGEAIAAVARGLGEAAAGGAAPGGEPGGGVTPPGGSTGEGFNAWPWIGLIAIGLGGWLLWRWWQRRRGTRLEAEERDRKTGQLAREANALLVETDEKVRQDEQELGFAEAQFGPEEAERFREALRGAREELKAAFTVRQRLDDAEPETPEQRQQMLTEIIERCRRAQATLDAQTERFRELRDLERRAPEIIGEERATIDALESRLTDADATIERLRAYAESAWRPVAGHVVEARKRIALARQLADAGEQAITSGDRKRAARSAKAMQDARGQAAQLLDAVATLERTLREAMAALPAAIADVRHDLAQARAAAATDATGGGTATVAQLEQKLAAAETAASSQPPDPLEARRLITEANAAADALLASQREAAEQRQRQATALRTAQDQASAEIDRASDYVAARRAGIGRRARTQIAEAQRHLAASHAASEHATALAEAQRAIELGKAALASARADFEVLESSNRRGTILVNGDPYGPWQTGRRRRPPGWGDGDIAGDIIGGIIGGILAGGGRGGGWGGGGFGGFGGGSSGGGGIFGGGGGGAGRSFGGGFGGGGGGRSRGGGW